MLSQRAAAFLYTFAAGEPASAAEFNHNFETLRAGAVPVGALMPFAGEQVPHGWLLCDGSHVSAEEFPELARVLGDSWGTAEDGFVALPDLRGRFLRGAHDPTGLDPDDDRQVGTLQAEDFKRHAHRVNPHTHRVNLGGSTKSKKNGTRSARDMDDEGARETTPASPMTNEVGGEETRPDNAAVHYIIRASALISPLPTSPSSSDESVD